MNISKISGPLLSQVLKVQVNSSDAKKQKILEATIELLATAGIANVTFESVGDKLNTTKANIRYHFNDKDDLIFSAIMLVVLTAQRITGFLVEKADTPSKKLEAIVHGAYKHLEIAPHHARVLLIYFYLSGIDSQYRNFYRETKLIGRGRLKLILQALGHRGRPLTNSQYELLADLIQNIITGQVLSSILTGSRIPEGIKISKEAIRSVLQSKGLEW